MALLGKRKFKKTEAKVIEPPEIEEPEVEDYFDDEISEPPKRKSAVTSKTVSNPNEKKIAELMAEVNKLQAQIGKMDKEDDDDEPEVKEQVVVVREIPRHPLTGELIRNYHNKETGITYRLMTDLEALTKIVRSLDSED